MATSYLRAPAGASGAQRVDPAEAIDDLAKFRLVESMLRQPDVRATAQELAARLGFHSVEYTAMALDELVATGVLRAARQGGRLSYWVTPDPELRAGAADLIAKGPPSLFNRLAAGSVQRIRKLLRKRR